MNKPKPKTVEEYILAAPDQAHAKLREIRAILHEVAPLAEEQLKWGVPVMIEKRILFSYTAYKKHLNFMPTGPCLEPFREELQDYTLGQDTIQFPYDQPLPRDLILKIAYYRYRQVLDEDAKWRY